MIDYVSLLAPPLLLVSGAVWVDLRTRRGYGLALLSLALIGLSVWSYVAFQQALQHAPSSESFGIGFVMVVYILTGIFLALILWIGALIEAGVARQRRWLVVLVMSAALAGLVVPADLLLNPVAHGFNSKGTIELALILFLPTVTVLAYGASRIMRPPR